MAGDPYLNLRKRVQRKLEGQLGLAEGELSTERTLRQIERVMASAGGQITGDVQNVFEFVGEHISDLLIDERVRLSDFEHERMSALIVGDLLGLGPLDAALNDATVGAVYVLDSGTIYVERGGRSMPGSVGFDDERQLRKVMRRIFEPLGYWLGETTDAVAGHLANGSRVDAILSSELAPDGAQLVVRKQLQSLPTLANLVEDGVLPQQAAELLRSSVLARRNILIAGKARSGKTRLLAALGNSLPEASRLVTVEEAAELTIGHVNTVRLEASPQHSARYTGSALLEFAPALLADLILLGDVTPGVAGAYLELLTRHAVCATLTARSVGGFSSTGTGPRQAVDRLMALVLQSNPALDGALFERQLGLGLNMIVMLEDDKSGLSQVGEIAWVRRAGGGLSFESIYKAEEGPTDALTMASNELADDVAVFTSPRVAGESGELAQPLFADDGALDDATLDELHIVQRADGTRAFGLHEPSGSLTHTALDDPASDMRRAAQLADDDTLLWSGTHPDGTRMVIVRPPVAVDGLTVSAEQFNVQPDGLKRFALAGMLTPDAGNLLVGAVRAGRGILVCGPAGSGKRGLIYDLLALIQMSKRVVSLTPLPPTLPARENLAHMEGASANAILQSAPDLLLVGHMDAETRSLWLGIGGRVAGVAALDCGAAVDPLVALSNWHALQGLQSEAIAPASFGEGFSLVMRMGRVEGRQRMLLGINELFVQGAAHRMEPLFRAQPSEAGGLELAQVGSATF